MCFWTPSDLTGTLAGWFYLNGWAHILNCHAILVDSMSDRVNKARQNHPNFCS